MSTEHNASEYLSHICCQQPGSSWWPAGWSDVCQEAAQEQTDIVISQPMSSSSPGYRCVELNLVCWRMCLSLRWGSAASVAPWPEDKTRPSQAKTGLKRRAFADGRRRCSSLINPPWCVKYVGCAFEGLHLKLYFGSTLVLMKTILRNFNAFQRFLKHFQTGWHCSTKAKLACINLTNYNCERNHINYHHQSSSRTAYAVDSLCNSSTPEPGTHPQTLGRHARARSTYVRRMV